MDTRVIVQFFQAAAAAIAVGRLTQLRYAGRFRALIAYLLFLAVTSFGFGTIPQSSPLYFWLYLLFAPLNCALGIAAVSELFALVFVNYPGIRTVGRWSMYAGLGISTAISLFFTGFFWSAGAPGRAHSHLFYFEISQRAIMLNLAVVIGTILFFLSRYPLHLTRNTLIASASFSALFLCEAARLLIDSLAPSLYNARVDRLADSFIAVCLIGWAITLRPEPVSVERRIVVSTPEEDHLLRQLASLNQILGSAAKRNTFSFGRSRRPK